MKFRCGLLRRVVVVLAMLVSGPALAAGFTCAISPGSVDQDEAAQVASRARETVSGPDAMQAWLRRLVGRYTYDGFVDLCGKGHPADRRPVTGMADCIEAASPPAGSPPSVHCKVNVHWQEARRPDGEPMLGGISNLAPAQFLFSIESPGATGSFVRGEGPGGWGIVMLQVDSRRSVEWASGVLVGDTFQATESCVDRQGHCSKTTRVTASPGSNEISMLVDITIDRQRVLHQSFLLRRSPGVPPQKRSTGSP